MQCTSKRRHKHIRGNDVDLGISDEIYCVGTCYAMFVNGINDLQYINLSTRHVRQMLGARSRHVRPYRQARRG
jgi:predicted metal-binding membrane protein